MIKYLPKTRVFISLCEERYLKVWRINSKERKHNELCCFSLRKEIDFIYVFMSKEVKANYDRFLVAFESGETEIFEFSTKDDKLYWIETEKSREHDV